MVSEDSQRHGWLAEVHCLSDFGDLKDPVDRQMSAILHELQDLYELVEVFPLRRPQGVFEEERDNGVSQVADPSNAVPVHRLPVVVRPVVAIQIGRASCRERV